MRTEAARATISAVVGCVRETVTNATKHSGADRVEVDASVAGETLTVYVRDHGRGFSVTRGSVGLGITESIVGRARDNDFRAGIASRPGLGTTVHLSIPLAARHNAPPAAQTDPQDRRATTTTTTTTSPAQKTPSTTGDALHRHASELWAFGATVVSMILTLIDGEDKYAALLPMIGLMLFSSVAYRWMPAARDHPAFVIALSVTTGLVFYLSAAATGFGSVDPIHWQALAPTAPFILLLTLRSDWHFRVTAAFPWLVAIAVAGAGQATSPTAARIVVVAGAVGLGFSALWSVFQTTLYRLGEHAAESAWAEHEALLRAELVDATQQSNRRWAAAGLESAIGLLREIAEGRRDLRSDCTRGDCEREERYLRQIT